MTDPFDEGIEERLRAALRAEAGSVEPSPEALAAIRERTERRRRTGWLGLPWLRPALAVGAAAAIAGTVLMGTPQFRDQLLPASFDSRAEQDQEGPRDLAVSEREANDDTRPESDRESPGAEDPSGRGEEDRPGGAEDPAEEESGGASIACVTPEPDDSADPSPSASSRDGTEQDPAAPQAPECDPEEGSGGTDGEGDGHPGENPDPGGDDGGGGGGEDPEPGDGGGGGSPSPDPGGKPDPGTPPDVPVE
ncbi:hypothetical protein [Nocardiopsis potens]|uniref:hypothetical protein n=1 Tax=Nocardiopsis potens TaxID=1246458 RepID=UPI0003495413|nr:hypothetical protein [Nocardiopsis potens]